MNYIYNDGGRKAAGYKGTCGDCVTRAIAIATGIPYELIYDELAYRIKEYFAALHPNIPWRLISGRRGGRRGTTPRNGVNHNVYRPFLLMRGWRWHETPGRWFYPTDFPTGRVIVQLPSHLVTVIDGVIHDTYDCSMKRGRLQRMKGYYTKG